MSDKPAILVVDDDVTVQAVFTTALKSHYAVNAVGSGDAALEFLSSHAVKAVLLDVSMPGIDGYETCRQIKSRQATAMIPVIFVSARDSIEDRLKGYDAGGEDYIVKPFDMPEIIAKLAHLIQLLDERYGLQEVAKSASNTAMTAMTNLSELGVLVDITKQLGLCGTPVELADTLVAGLNQYGLNSTAQVREQIHTYTRSNGGNATPLEASIIEHMAAERDRIVQFKSRLSIHYDHVSLLVYDLPIEDPERCGRLRDHLAMLIEAAESRYVAIHHNLIIKQTIGHITEVLEDIDHSQRGNRVSGRLAIERMSQRLTQAYASVALSTDQEDFMNAVVNQGTDELIQAYEDKTGIQDKLTLIVNELKTMAIKR